MNLETWNVRWDSKWIWTEWESPVTANLPRSQPFTFSASLATILLRHPDYQHISLKIRPRERGSRRRETWDSRHFLFVNLFAFQLFNVVVNEVLYFFWDELVKKSLGNLTSEILKENTWLRKTWGPVIFDKTFMALWLLSKRRCTALRCDLLSTRKLRGGYHHSIPRSFAVAGAGWAKRCFEAKQNSTKALLLFIWGWPTFPFGTGIHHFGHGDFWTFLMRFVGLFRGGDQRPDWWFSTWEWRWEWTAERTEHSRSTTRSRRRNTRTTRNTRSWNEARRWNPK